MFRNVSSEESGH